MTAISSLLNPMSERRLPMPHTPTRQVTAVQTPASPRKKVKLTKDAAVFQYGPTRGECRFPPDESQDELLAAYHQQFEVSPFGEIADYPRHIPYNSEKKRFQDLTGRECLEVFQYTFKKPGDETLYTMLWDYNIGLVRTTPLFKCTGHSKTTPAKMLNKNPGLRDVCHSITGGALVAQGYWIPFAAAKAIAATFCYEIRYALTPVFGQDFPRMCIKPGAEGFGDMTIDPEITQHCKDEARRFREAEPKNTSHILTSDLSSRTPSPSLQRVGCGRAKFAHVLRSPYESPKLGAYDSDTSSVDNYTLAPSSPPVFRNPWPAVNDPRTPPRSVPHQERRLPSPRSIMDGYHSRPTFMLDAPLTPPTTIVSRASSIEHSPTAVPIQPVSALRSTCYNDRFPASDGQDNEERLSGAISLLCTATGLSEVELARRLDLTNETQKFNDPLDAAITMISLKTGLTWKEVTSRLDLADHRHKRFTSW